MNNLNSVLFLYVQSKKTYLKESTYARYSNLIDNHIKGTIGLKEMNNLTNKDFQLFCDDELAKGTSIIVIREIILLIKLAIKREAKINGTQPLFIDLDLPSITKKKKIQILSRNDQKSIINYIFENDKQKYSGVILSLLTGLRIGELCALKWTDIDLKKRIIIVNKTLQRICFKGKESKITITNPKTQNSDREIPISNALYDFLMSIKPTKRDNYFLTGNDKYTEPRNYRKIYKTLLKKLKINTTSFHALRHTFATRLIENKVDIKTVSELLGHASVNITISIYVHSEFNTKRKAVKTLDSLILK
jgi:integrase